MKLNPYPKKFKALSLAVASIAMLTGNRAKAVAPVDDPVESNDAHIAVSKNRLKTKLVLKLNMTTPEASKLMMHTSHSSHSSHASHASHASHSSSSPTYTPSVPVYTPSSPRPPVRRLYSGSSLTTVDTARVLVKGMMGDDVKHMQELLKAKGYIVPVSGYFGEQTELAVKKFQKLIDLPQDGKVSSTTLSFLSKP